MSKTSYKTTRSDSSNDQDSKQRVVPNPKPAPDQKFADRNLTGVNPTKQQFEPADGQAVRQRFKMAGGC